MEIVIQRSSMLNTINVVGNVFKTVGLDPFKLKADKIINKAVKQAGYEGSIPESISLGLTTLIDSIKKESRINPFGSLAMKGLLERTLYGRLKIEQVLAADPAITQAEIKVPVLIVGMPRTGTTILHALLHKDTAHRSPLAWECLIPYPVPTPETQLDNPSLDVITKEFDQLFKLVPDFKKKHYMEPNSPQECLGINMLDFNSFQVCAQVYVPTYLDWFMNQADKLETMRFHKRFLQYMQSGGVRSERWLLKTPVHMMRMKQLFEVYPDAKIIMTHRHPAKVVASATSLISSVRSLYSNHEDVHRSGVEQCKMWSESFDRFLADRKELNREDQIIDLKFEDFVGDQMGTVKKIYEKFGWKLSSQSESNMGTFLAANPKDKHGAHNYSLEQIGLTPEIINEQYKDYIKVLENL